MIFSFFFGKINIIRFFKYKFIYQSFNIIIYRKSISYSMQEQEMQGLEKKNTTILFGGDIFL